MNNLKVVILLDNYIIDSVIDLFITVKLNRSGLEKYSRLKYPS